MREYNLMSVGRMMARLQGLLATVAVLLCVANAAAQEDDFRIVPGERVGLITPESSESSLRAAYGDARVTPQEVHIGEGSFEPGARILFDDGASAEIVWRDPSCRCGVRSVTLLGSQWRTAEGIAMGFTLKDLERINGGRFQLVGFAVDYAGTIVSWDGGLLERSTPQDNPGPRVILALLPDQESYQDLPQEDQNLVAVWGPHSSAHPTMQHLNPSVYALRVRFD